VIPFVWREGRGAALWLDERGFPLGFDITSYGVQFRRTDL
jgi:hypothetical protein